MSTYIFFIIAFNLLTYTQSLQSGYTCETSVTLKCPSGQKLVVLEATYSSECPKVDEELNGISIYPPSRCIGYYRKQISNQCNGKEMCMINNELDIRPTFSIGDQANCNFRGQSINIEYSCVPDFYSSKLPRIDICSLQSTEEIKEGFIHTPSYPNNYPNDLSCLKKIPEPEPGHRLKIYAIDFDLKSASLTRTMNVLKVNDWLEINDNDEKFYGTRESYTLLFDDVIEASLNFKTNSANIKRSYKGFLLYFIVVPIRRSRPVTTKRVPTTTEVEIIFDGIQEKTSALVGDTRSANTTILLLLVILLSSILFIIICGFILYRRRNDRRIRYLTETFNSFIPNRLKSGFHPEDNSDGSDLKFDVSSSSNSDDKYNPKYSDKVYQESDHIYSQDPLENSNISHKNDQNSIVYDYIDDNMIYQQVVKPNQNIV